MPVGDVTSKEAGSGARYNDEKLPMHQVPVRYWRIVHDRIVTASLSAPCCEEALLALQLFQEGDDAALKVPLTAARLRMAMAVFQYGEAKYALYNWTKGMAWSIPTACALRHIDAVVNGEELDPESGLPHMGHVWCNLIMLDWFVDHYPEGDDRPYSRRQQSDVA